MAQSPRQEADVRLMPASQMKMEEKLNRSKENLPVNPSFGNKTLA